MATDSVTPPEGYNIVDTSSLPAGYSIVPPPSPLESAGEGLVNNFPLAKQAVSALSPGAYSKNLQEMTNEAAQAKAANPKSYGAGAVGGALAPLAIPGVGEALEASPVAGNAALGALNGINDVDLQKNPGQAVKQAAIGAGIGGAVGKAGEALLGNAPEKLTDLANSRAVQTLGLNPKFLGHLEPSEVNELGQFADDNNLVNGPLEQRLGKAEALNNAYGTKIGEIGASATPGEAPKTQDLMQKMMQYSGSANREAKGLARDYESGIKDLIKLGDNPTFKQLQDLKGMYGDLAFNGDHTVKNQAAADVYGIIKDTMKDTVASAPEEYQDALKGYSRSYDIKNGLTKQLGQERAGTGGTGGFGMMGAVRRLPGPLRAIAGIGGALTGHPIIPVAAALPELTNPAVHSAVLRGMANAAPKVQQGMSQELTDYLTSKFGGQK